MTGEPIITIVGNIVADPELRFTPNGAAVANFTVASTPRNFDKLAGEWVEGETLFMRCSLWKDLAENVAESLRKGMRVIVQGRLKSRSWETKEGQKRTNLELEVDDIGPSLRFAIANVTRKQRGGGQQGGYQQGGQYQNSQGQTVEQMQANAANQNRGGGGQIDPWQGQANADYDWGQPQGDDSAPF